LFLISFTCFHSNLFSIIDNFSKIDKTSKNEIFLSFISSVKYKISLKSFLPKIACAFEKSLVIEATNLRKLSSFSIVSKILLLIGIPYKF